MSISTHGVFKSSRASDFCDRDMTRSLEIDSTSWDCLFGIIRGIGLRFRDTCCSGCSDTGLKSSRSGDGNVLAGSFAIQNWLAVWTSRVGFSAFLSVVRGGFFPRPKSYFCARSDVSEGA